MRESGIGNVEGTFPIPFPKKFQHEITVYIGIHFPEFARVSGLVDYCLRINVCDFHFLFSILCV